MRVRKLEEVLEESLSAYLHQGRSVEESLRLYPEFRGELEPLLRTAIQVSDTFQSFDPPLAVQQRGLARFLSDARGRARLNSLREETRPSWLAGLFSPQGKLGFAGVGAIVAVIAVAVGAAAMMFGDDDRDRGGGPVVERPSPTEEADDNDQPAEETPAAVSNVQDQINKIRRLQARGEAVPQSDVDELSRLVSELPASVASEEGNQNLLREVELILNEADAVVTVVAQEQPEIQPAAVAADTTIDQVRGVLGIEVPTPTAPPVAVDPTSVPTAPPVSEPLPTPIPTEPVRCPFTDDCPTAPPTPDGQTPVPTEAPTPTEPPREPFIAPGL
jgi:hypothetical protein